MRFGDHPPYSHAWAALLLRILVGWVFLTEGIQKFLLPIALGYGRFEKIGDSVPAYQRAVRRRSGNCMRHIASGRIGHSLRRLSAADRHLGRDRDHQGTDPASSGILAGHARGPRDFCMLVGLIAILCTRAVRLRFYHTHVGGGQISCDAKRVHGRRITEGA